ncbi:MAG TPA: hypothetical protein VM098_00530, partial [Phycisphaerae bacterium]|nr:hypothetical protein [Phycisphaerae bacterium]
AAVIAFTDARFADAASARNAARRLGAQNVPVTTVLLGSTKPPRDAAIISVEAPGVVYASDKVQFKIDLKLDGMAGQPGCVTVYRLDAAGNKITDNPIREGFAVPPDTDSLDLTVELTDKNTEKIGLHEYLVEVTTPAGKCWDGEALKENNAYPVAVNVSNDRTRLLLIEGRPRWEFRYIKNLFSDRDPTVQLQYVLLERDKIQDAAVAQMIVASAGRPYGEVEATRLPGHAEKPLNKDDFVKEWKKFDMVILGDVSRQMLRDEDLEALEKFVGDRGGTLVVIAGPRHMPHNFAGTPLEHMLPVAFRPGDHYVRGAVRPIDKGGQERLDEAYRVAVTAEGERHAIMQQTEDRQENQRLWQSMPDMQWRYPIEDTKVAATVLAYATDPSYAAAEAGPAKEPKADEMRKREEFQRKNALISVQKYKGGQVLFLSFDRTWRFRYRIGDTYHHKFWGQVLRWATGDKLAAGTRLVRIGTSKSRYGPEENVKVEAKILNADFDPLDDTERKNVVVKILRNGQSVREEKMSVVAGSLGRFEADLGDVGAKYGPGDYRAELHSQAVSDILAKEGTQNVVATRFRVAEKMYDEQKYLASDPATAEDLARASRGKVVRPHEVPAIADGFGEGMEVRTDHRQSSLWDSWPMLAMIVVAATAEWVIRKRVGLA